MHEKKCHQITRKSKADETISERWQTWKFFKYTIMLLAFFSKQYYSFGPNSGITYDTWPKNGKTLSHTAWRSSWLQTVISVSSITRRIWSIRVCVTTAEQMWREALEPNKLKARGRTTQLVQFHVDAIMSSGRCSNEQKHRNRNLTQVTCFLACGTWSPLHLKRINTCTHTKHWNKVNMIHVVLFSWDFIGWISHLS